jgi:hypothetical protein
MKLQTVVCYSVAAAALARTGVAQTRIDLRTQGKSVDFSAASSTSPSQIGIQLSTTCQVGATFVLTSAAAGQNWYLCTSANQWTVQGGQAGSGLPSLSGNANTILSTDGVSLIWKTLGGDIGGAPASVTVTGLLGRKLNTTAPTTGQLLVWDGALWSPQTVSITAPVTKVFGRTGAVVATTGDYTFAQLAGSVASGQLPAAGGDLSGAITAATVIKIQSRAIAATAPVTGQVLTWSGTQWAPQNQTGGVPSVFGRTGAVTAQAGDYTAAQVTNAVDKTNFNLYTAGARQTFLASLTGAGIQIAPGPLPSVASAGDMAVDSAASNQLKIYNGNAWVVLNPNVTFPPGNYVTFFTAQTSVTVPGVTHGLGTANLLVQCYDNATPANLVEPSLITIDPNSFNVTVVFATAETGRCVINGYNGGTGGSGGSPAPGGAGMAGQLGDFAVVITSPTTLSIGSNCSISTPCNVRFGTQVYSITAAGGVTITGGSGLVYIYMDTTGALTAGSLLTTSCGGSCIVAPNITGFPINTIPLYTWSASVGVWDATGGVDRRGWLSSNPLLGGPGIATVAAAGQTTISVDSAIVPTYLTASVTLDFPMIPAGTCSADMTLSLPGANPGDAVAAGWPAAMQAGLSGTMRVSAADVVSVRLCADTTGAVNPVGATFTATVVRGF